MLLFTAVQETRLLGLADAEPQAMTLAELAASGPGDNAHVLLSDVVLCDWDYVSTERRGRWTDVWLPAVPLDGPLTIAEPAEVRDVTGARCLVKVGDSITTDHISPAGATKPDSPAGQYLQSLGVQPKDFNSYGSRRGNHEVMMRGTFANVRLKNELTPGVEGSSTLHFPAGDATTIFDAAMKYRADDVPTIVLAGKEYGTGSSRDWAAKGPSLLGIRVAIAESFERIHRSNLVGMGILPLEFPAGQSANSLGLTGHETFDITGIAALYEGEFRSGGTIHVAATKEDGSKVEFDARLRIDTPEEAQYYRHGGILHYVLRRLSKS